MVCTFKTRHTECSIADVIFTCDVYTSGWYCFFIKLFLIVNILFTVQLFYESYIYLFNRKIALKDYRNWIILLAIILSCFNWLNYTFLKTRGWSILIIFTLNFFLYFLELCYFMTKALTFIRQLNSDLVYFCIVSSLL